MASSPLDLALTHEGDKNLESVTMETSSATSTLTTSLTSPGKSIIPTSTTQSSHENVNQPNNNDSNNANLAKCPSLTPPSVFVIDNNSDNNSCNITNKLQQQSSHLKFGSGPLCILTPCSNSHPFEERRISVTRSEENAVKIGRSVVRLQPSTNNAIFDCKVLSRNHAILWVNNDGQFMIKDTRSSNGTFINSERLSASGEESESRELFSGDILQLGVEIIDNTKKVASGCVTCIVRLINEHGEECAGRQQNDAFSFSIHNEQQIPLNYNLVRNDKLFILDQYIKEAKFRENVLGQKLQFLEEQLSIAQEALQKKWDEHINQELLFSRIELLESQLLYFATKSTTISDEEKNLRQEMQQLMEDRAKAEQLAKETFREKFEQVQETTMRLHDAEIGIVNMEEECAFLRQRCADFEDKQSKQREEYDALLTKYSEVCTQLSTAERASVDANINSISTTSNQILNGDMGEIPINICSKSQEINKSAELFKTNENATLFEDAINNTDDAIKWIEIPPLIETAKNEDATTDVNPATLSLNTAHQCQEYELKEKLAELHTKLQQLQEKHEKLFQKYLQISDKTNIKMEADDGQQADSIANSLSAADFQVFILSVFPFLFIIILFFAPFFHFLGSSWIIGPVKSNKVPSDELNDNSDNLIPITDKTIDDRE